MSKKITLAARQKRTVIVAVILIALLAISTAVASYFVGLGEFEDTDGTKYTVKKENGEYALFDANGYRLDTTQEDGKTYFVTDIGTLVSVSDAGKTSIFAVVDTADGEVVSDLQRLLIFPKVDTEKLRSLKIVNETGTYTFTRNQNGKMCIKGYEEVAYNAETYSYLAAFCGNLVAMERYGSETVEKYGLAEYGLDEPTATFSVSSTEGRTYTIHMGDPIVSGNGYYVMLEGRNTVYIINSYYSMVTAPVEYYVKPVLAHGLTSMNYPEVYNFKVYSFTYDAEGKAKAHLDTALTFWPLSERENTEYQTQVYKMVDEALMGYIPNTNSVTTTMEKIAQPSTATVVKLGADPGSLEKYGLDKPIKLISYETNLKQGNSTFLMRTYISVSEMTEDRTHYVTTEVQLSEDGENFYTMPAYDLILEMDRSELLFAGYGPIDWVEQSYFSRNIMIVDSFEIVTGGKTYTLYLEADEEDITKVTAVFDGKSVNIDIDEFKIYYRNLLYGKLYDATGLSDEEHKAIADKDENFQFSFRVKTKVNKLDHTYAFYRMSEIKSYLTINGGGEFYVLGTFVEKYASDIVDLVNGLPLTPLSQ